MPCRGFGAWGVTSITTGPLLALDKLGGCAKLELANEQAARLARRMRRSVDLDMANSIRANGSSKHVPEDGIVASANLVKDRPVWQRFLVVG